MKNADPHRRVFDRRAGVPRQLREPLRVVLRRSFIVLAVLGIFGSSSNGSPAVAQVTPNFSVEFEPEPEGLELLQGEPYDLIRFKASAGGGWVKVPLLKLPVRKMPEKPTGSLQMNVRGLPGKTYEAKWADIESIDFWEIRLRREITERMNANDFAGAYPYLAILYRDNPGSDEVMQIRRDFLIRNARDAIAKDRLLQAFAMLEELRSLDASYQRDEVRGMLGKITDTLMQQMSDRGRLEDAQKLLYRLKQDYRPDEIESIKRWDEKFLALAMEKRGEALAARDEQQWRKARQLALDSIALFPAIEGGKELVTQIDREYPLVSVGVLQTATVLDPTAIDNWPARRSGRLVYRALFEMRSAGSEGGEYEFLFGAMAQTPDRLQLQMELRPERVQGALAAVDSFVIADRIQAMAQGSRSEYAPAWAATMESMSVPGPLNLNVFMRRPHVLPHALLQIMVDGSWAGLPPGSPTGDYDPLPANPAEPALRRYLLSSTKEDPGTRPQEILEVQQDDAAVAVTSLLRGDLDVIDHLFPADAKRLQNRSDIRVGNYPLPTVHLLIPVSNHPYLADRNFRRAICYGISREAVLREELLGNTNIPGCQVISGPFPAGVTPDDPLGYAYDTTIEPRSYQPRLASLLRTMTIQRLKVEAEKDSKPAPELTPIRLGYPQDDLARIACQAIAQQLNMVEIPVQLVELPTGITRPAEPTCDLLYTVVALWEPITDARRVLGPEGLARSNDQLVGSGLRLLERARNWREVRQRLLELHFIVHHELPVIPLWQLVDSYAYRTSLAGVGADIVALYQNLDRWRLTR